jgi:putative aldouronate transport system permease protein
MEILKTHRKAIKSEATRSTLGKQIFKYKLLYLMLLPTIIYYIVFQFVPYYGLVIAFQDFQPFKGIKDSPWVGFEHFQRLFLDKDFYRLLVNTILISFYKLLFGFPVPIIFALLLNEIKHVLFKRTVQTITYFPHFFSWVVYGGLFVAFLSPLGVINGFLVDFGLKPIEFLTDSSYFRPMIIISSVLKEFGWGAIIYLAALTSIDPHLYEAATVDGAGRWRRMVHVSLPGLASTAIVLFILQLGYLMDAGFEQIFVMSNPSVYGVADIIDTYVYRIGLQQANFSEATAIGLFKGVVGFIFIISANYIIKKNGQNAIW